MLYTWATQLSRTMQFPWATHSCRRQDQRADSTILRMDMDAKVKRMKVDWNRRMYFLIENRLPCSHSALTFLGALPALPLLWKPPFTEILVLQSSNRLQIWRNLSAVSQLNASCLSFLVLIIKLRCSDIFAGNTSPSAHRNKKPTRRESLRYFAWNCWGTYLYLRKADFGWRLRSKSWVIEFESDCARHFMSHLGLSHG